MFGRLMNVIKGMLNKGISKVETPEILAEQAQMELEGSVKQLKSALVSAMTAEKALEQKIQKDTEQAGLWQKRAELAVSKGDDELAKQCLQKRQEAGAGLEGAKQQLEGQKQATAALKMKLTDAENKMRSFQAQKKDMIARHQASVATANAHEIISGSASGSGALDKLEEKIRQKELMNEANAEISGMGMKDRLLEEKIKELDATSDIDIELLAMKERMAASNPKLIESRDSKPDVPLLTVDDAVTVEEVKEES